MPYSSTSKKRRRLLRGVQEYIPSDDEDGSQATPEYYTCMQLTSTNTGSLSLRHRHFSLSSIPEPSSIANQESENQAESGITEPHHIDQELDDSVDNINDLAQGLDPAYIRDKVETGVEEIVKRKRGAGDFPLLQWIPEIDTFLAELLRLEGKGDIQDDLCPQCRSEVAVARCEVCNDVNIYCTTCIVKMHSREPLHRIEIWTGFYFKRVGLKELGLRIQLGHHHGKPCKNPERSFADTFILLDIDGIHEVSVDFCGCENILPHYIQILRARWFPATVLQPRTAATFRLLHFFHILSLQAGISAYEFYTSLARRTSNTGLEVPKDRYMAFIRMTREWSHLKLLKRAGRGHSISGRNGTSLGELAVLCPACPHPNKNLPDDWQSAPKETRWLYRLFIGLDANFRAKRKCVSSDTADPGLNTGLAYFVDEDNYKSFLKQHDTPAREAPSTCNNYDALKLVNKKHSHGLAATGLASVECTRHDMKRPYSTGDLQKGERYVNMDYLFFSSISQNAPTRLVVSYDIACQWSKNLWTRLENYGQKINYDEDTVTFLIPKFHLPAHKDLCHSLYSFNLTTYVGRTDGEAVERGWAFVNGFASSTKEMGPGARRDRLDDVFGDYNWRKITILAKTMLTRLKAAQSCRNEQIVAFNELNEVLPPESISAWSQNVEAWEDGRTSNNPYLTTHTTETQAAVRLQLAEEDAKRVSNNKDSIVHDEISACMLLTAGLDLEEQQRHLATDVKNLGRYATELQRAKILERRNGLQRRIDAWRGIQQRYIPGISSILTRAQDPNIEPVPIPAEKISLYLPSDSVISSQCDFTLLLYEWRLRYAQAHDALHSLRRHLCLRSHLFKFKDRHVRGQRDNTRSRGIINSVEEKIKADTLCYRTAYKALSQLGPLVQQSNWQRELRQLNDTDIRGMVDSEDNQSEGRRTLSWIWVTTGVGMDEHAGMQEALRIEWCKARARAYRWNEECILLREEMRRILQFHDWHATWWERQIGHNPLHTKEILQGASAYAYRQAALRRTMREQCITMWKEIQTEDTETH